jgi:hypothetical protein
MADIQNEELIEGNLDVFNETPAATPEVKIEAPVVPEKYQGKTLADIVKMHQEAEKLIGKQAQEVGEVRKLADELLKQQLSQTKQEPIEEDPEVDFFVDPKQAVKKAVDSHPDVLAAKKAVEELNRSKSVEGLHKRHPDMTEIVQTPEFVEWVKASPRRVKLYAQADAQYDTEAADELLTTFKEVRSARTQQAKNDGAEMRNQTLKQAAVDTGGSGEVTRKVYRRADLIRLKMTDPSRYEQLNDEIMSAYREGRVK